MSALLINCFVKSLVKRCGLDKISGQESQNIELNIREDLKHISYNILENFIRGFILYPRPLGDNYKIYDHTLKLYNLLQS